MPTKGTVIMRVPEAVKAIAEAYANPGESPGDALLRLLLSIATAPKGNPSEPKGNPSEPKGNPSEPKGNPSDPKGNPSEPKGNPSEPKGNPSEPKGNPSEPKGNPSEPKGNPSDPKGNPSDPKGNPSDPKGNPSEPKGNPSDPKGNPSDPLPPRSLPLNGFPPNNPFSLDPHSIPPTPGSITKSSALICDVVHEDKSLDLSSKTNVQNFTSVFNQANAYHYALGDDASHHLWENNKKEHETQNKITPSSSQKTEPNTISHKTVLAPEADATADAPVPRPWASASEVPAPEVDLPPAGGAFPEPGEQDPYKPLPEPSSGLVALQNGFTPASLKDWLRLLDEENNRQPFPGHPRRNPMAILGRMYLWLVKDIRRPSPQEVGQVASALGGALSKAGLSANDGNRRLLATRIWELSARPVIGDPLDYLVGMLRNRNMLQNTHDRPRWTGPGRTPKWEEFAQEVEAVRLADERRRKEHERQTA